MAAIGTCIVTTYVLNPAGFHALGQVYHSRKKCSFIIITILASQLQLGSFSPQQNSDMAIYNPQAV